MYIGVQRTTHNTRRIYIRARDTETTTPFFDSFQTVRQFLNALSCWGGPDHSNRDTDDKGGYVSWEIPDENHDLVYDTLNLLLKRLHFNVVQDIVLATDIHDVA
jgi:hypothetical protein